MTVRRFVILAVVATVALAVQTAPPGRPAVVAAAANPATVGAPGSAGSFQPLTPTRVLDTRLGPNGSPITAYGSRVVSMSGHGIPASGVAAVVLNLTVTQPGAAGYLTAWAHGSTRPATSNVNFVRSQTVANLAVVPVGPDNAIALYDGSSGDIHVIVDVSGYYLAGAPTAPGALVPVAPARLLDTRIGDDGTVVPPGGTLDLTVAGRGGLPASGVGSVALNVTATEPGAAGYITVWPGAASRPTASNLNFIPGETVAGLVMVAVGTDGKVELYNGSAASIQLIADVSAYTVAGVAGSAGDYTPLSPSRLLDTRSVGHRLEPGATWPLFASGFGGLPATGMSAVVLTVTVVDPSGPGYVTAYPAGDGQPVASNVNFVAGQTVPNTAVVPVGQGTVELFNGSASWVDLVVDVSGYYLGPPALTWTSPNHVDTADALRVVSCATSTFCVAVDQGDRATQYDGATWSTPAVIDPGGSGLITVTCVSTSFCVALDVASRAIIYNGTTWGTPIPITIPAGPATQLACASATFCLAIASAGGAAVFNGATWTAIAAPPELTALSCPPGGQNSCIAVAFLGDVYDYESGFWSGPDVDIDQGYYVPSVDCLSTSFCMALTSTGTAIPFVDGTWAQWGLVDPVGGTMSVSCGSPTMCVAVDSGGLAMTFDGASWTEPATVDPIDHTIGGLNSVSCPTTTFCVAVDESGYIVQTT